MTVALMSHHPANMSGYKHTTDLDEVSRYCFPASSLLRNLHVLLKSCISFSVSLVLQYPSWTQDSLKDTYQDIHNGAFPTTGPFSTPGKYFQDTMETDPSRVMSTNES